MAITIVQKPENFVPIKARAIISATSTNDSQPKFRYKVTLKDGATVISTSYVDPDPNDFLIYDCAPRLHDMTFPQVHSGEATPSSRSPIFGIADVMAFVEVADSHMEIDVEVEESYAATVDDEPTDKGSPETFSFTIYPGDTLIGEGVNVANVRGVLNGVGRECLIEVSEEDSNGKVLHLTNEEYLSLPWFQANEDASPVTLWRMVITFADGSSAVEDITIAAGNTTGGGDGTVAYFMCGPKDLANFTGIAAANRPSASTEWARYILQPRSASLALGTPYTIIRNDRNCRFDHYQLAFVNKHGAWNYQSFYLLSNKKVQVDKGKRFIKEIAASGYGGEYGYDLYDREVEEFAKSSKVKIELNTDWLNQHQSKDLESVIYARDVRMMVNGDSTPVPVVVSNRTHRHDKYKKLRQYKITVEIAQRNYVL